MSITKGKTRPWAITPAPHPYAGRIITGMLTTPDADATDHPPARKRKAPSCSCTCTCTCT